MGDAVFNLQRDWDEVFADLAGEANTFAVALFSLGAELGAAGGPPAREGCRRPSSLRQLNHGGCQTAVRGTKRSDLAKARAGSPLIW